MRKVLFCRTEKFGDMRKCRGYYVDKTGFLETFLRFAPPKISVFALPRRFGKGVMLSMLGEFFDCARDSGELFAGLKIAANAQLCAQWMNRFPVVAMTLFHLGSCRSMEDALSFLQSRLCMLWHTHSFLLGSPRVEAKDREVLRRMWNEKEDAGTLGNALASLTRALAAHHGRPAILLIDDYDFPFVAAAEHGFYEAMHELMRRFLLGPLHNCPDCLLFCVLAGRRLINLADSTGKLPFPGRDIRTYDLFDTTFAGEFGFASDEVDRLLAEADLAEARQTVHTWYGGHRMGDEEDICCLWATRDYICDSLDSGNTAPGEYWPGSSRNLPVKACLRQLAVTGEDIVALLAGKCLVRKINTVHTLATLEPTADNVWSHLLQLGYLARASETVKNRDGVRPDRSLGEEALVIPNRDVHSVFVHELCDWFELFAGWSWKYALSRILLEADTASFVQMLEAWAQRPVPKPAWMAERSDAWGYGSECGWEEVRRKRMREDEEDDPAADPAPAGGQETALPADLQTVCLQALLTACFLKLGAWTIRPETDEDRCVPQDMEGREQWEWWDYDRGPGVMLAEVRSTTDAAADLAALAREGLAHLAGGESETALLADSRVATLVRWGIALCGRRCAACAAVVKGA